MTAGVLPPARRLWDVLEPIAASVYFAPEVHRAYEAVGHGGPSRTVDGVEYPNGLAYFTSRGACLGDGVSGHVIASAFGVFKRPMVIDAVDAGWRIADGPTIVAARDAGMVASLTRILGTPNLPDAPDGLGWATGVLKRMADAAPSEGRALSAGLRSLGYPGSPMGDFWRAGDIVREHRGDCHIAAWIGADLDATEIGLLTDPWRGQPLRGWVRSRGWTEGELDAACDRLRGRGLLDGDALSDAGRTLRESIESHTDAMQRRVIDALGDDHERFFALLDGWSKKVIDARAYPARVAWPSA